MKEVILHVKYDKEKKLHLNLENKENEDNIHLIIVNDDMNTQEKIIIDHIFYGLLEKKIFNNIEKITIKDPVYVSDFDGDIFETVKSINLPDKCTFRDFDFPLEFCEELEELNYKNINMMEYVNCKTFNNIAFKIIDEAYNGNIIPDKIKNEILNDLKYGEGFIISKYFDYPDIMEKIYYPRMLQSLLIKGLYPLVNSDKFYNFIKDKPINIRTLKDTYITKINNPDLIFKLWDKNEVVKYFKYLNEDIKINRDFLMKILVPTSYGVFYGLPLEVFKESLEYFKNDEDIIGLFAKRLCRKYEYENFLKIINKESTDLDTMYWLCANNISFIELLSEQDKEEYLLMVGNSYDCIKNNDPITLVSPFHIMRLNESKTADDKNIINVGLGDRVNVLRINYSFIEGSNMYQELKQLIDNIKEIELDNSNER